MLIMLLIEILISSFNIAFPQDGDTLEDYLNVNDDGCHNDLATNANAPDDRGNYFFFIASCNVAFQKDDDTF